MILLSPLLKLQTPTFKSYFKKYTMSSRLTDLQIEVAPNDAGAMSFALLQGHLKTLLGGSEQLTALKMDLVLFQLFTQFYAMQSDVLEGGQQVKNALQECSQAMESCRDDRQEVFKLSEDRLRLIKELKETTDQSLQLLQENQKLKTMLGAYEELNELLNTRHTQMELQLGRLAKNEGVKDSVRELQSQYNSILSDNLEIQQEMKQLGSRFQEFTIPLRVIRVAFASNASLRELVMRQAEGQLGANEELRELFMGFDFDLGGQ